MVRRLNERILTDIRKGLNIEIRPQDPYYKKIIELAKTINLDSPAAKFQMLSEAKSTKTLAAACYYINDTMFAILNILNYKIIDIGPGAHPYSSIKGDCLIITFKDTEP